MLCCVCCRASIVFVYDESQPRLIRVVMMTTALITIMVSSAIDQHTHIQASTMMLRGI